MISLSNGKQRCKLIASCSTVEAPMFSSSSLAMSPFLVATALVSIFTVTAVYISISNHESRKEKCIPKNSKKSLHPLQAKVQGDEKPQNIMTHVIKDQETKKQNYSMCKTNYIKQNTLSCEFHEQLRSLGHPCDKQDHPSNNQDHPSNNQDHSSNNQDYPSNNQDFPSNNQDFPSNNQDQPTDYQNYPTQDDQDQPCSKMLLHPKAKNETIINDRNQLGILNLEILVENNNKLFMEEEMLKEEISVATSDCLSTKTWNSQEENQSDSDTCPQKQNDSESYSLQETTSTTTTVEEYLLQQRIETKNRQCGYSWRASDQFCEKKRKEQEENSHSFLNMNSLRPRFRSTDKSITSSKISKLAASNRKLIQTALRQNLLAGPLLDKKRKESMLAIQQASTKSNFVLLLNDNNTPMTLSGIYCYEMDYDQVVKIFGNGPKIIRPHSIFQFYRYDCGNRMFNLVSEPTTVKKVDGISLYRT